MVNLHLPSPKYLPVDILGEIFSHVVTQAGIVDIPHRLANPTLPWSLGQVCSNWRDIIYSSPLLWQNIRLKASITDLSNGDLDRLDRILPYGLPAIYIKEDDWKRSDSKFTLGAPLLSQLRSLYIRASPSGIVELLSVIPSSMALSEFSLIVSESVTDELQNIALFTVSKNLTSLALGTRDITEPIMTATALLHLPHIPFDKLTRLDLKYLRHVPEIWDILSRCISLKDLILSGDLSIPPPLPRPFLPHLHALKMCNSSPAVTYHPFPWKQLTTLSISHNYPPCRVIEILQQTSHLESLSLIRNYSDGDTSKIVRLDSLQSLSVDIDYVHVLDFLNTPKLATLSLEKFYMGVMTCPLPVQKIKDFIARSGFVLESFHYESKVPYDEPEENELILHELLTVLPSLRNFSSSYLLFTDDILNEMKENVLLPKLQTLKICAASPSLFVDVLESRVNAELKEEGFIRLKTAFAYYDRYAWYKGPVPRSPLRRLNALNSIYGTDFHMVAG